MEHVMLDLETIGTTPGSAIVQIGAVSFTSDAVVHQWKANVSLESCVAAGLRMDASTVKWWIMQREFGNLSWIGEDMDLATALELFAEWIGPNRPHMWGDGAAFDNVLLASAYRALRRPVPWHFSRDRCYRTVRAMFPVVPVQSVAVHDALSDALAQVATLQTICRTYNIKLLGGRSIG